MAVFERSTPDGDVRIDHTVNGSGFPILLIAPGGMGSVLAAWEATP